MRTRIAAAVLTLSGLTALFVAARADEEKVPLDKVPIAVIETVNARFPGAKLTQAERETEEGKTTYEIALTHKGHKVEVSLTEGGDVIEVEKEVAAKDLPRPVADALKAKYPKATVKKAEEVTKGVKPPVYEIHIADDGKAREVVLDASGKVLKVEEGDED
jgi:uncharacterized membrane protein YkoI